MKQVLELIRTGGITPEEGRRRLDALRTPAPTPTPAHLETPEANSHGKIAIIGMAGRYGAFDSTEALWHGLAAGDCSVTEVPAHRWSAERYYDPDPRTPGKTNSRWGSFIDDVAGFDPLFFHLSGREAERMDPQQRLFLETCWTALEDAGYAGEAAGRTQCGVFAGAPASDYTLETQRSGPEADAQVMMGNDTAILASRISYLLDLRGPSIALNTACSSSLVAVQLACQAIRSGQCEMALAGGVCLFVGPSFYVSASKAGMLSPQGRCSAFDHEADGFVPGEGSGVVILKDLAAAQRDGDTIRGVILGVDTNQDGKSNGITAPSSKAQTSLQLSVYRQADISPETISLVEAHGTGTPLGDPIEVEALTRSFSAHTGRKQFCAIGSVKSNLGHTGQAAGVAGLIKCLLAFEHETIPPTLHFNEENARIGFADTPFYPVTESVPWPRVEGNSRRAAVSSYGYSGTNAHLVVEEPPLPTRSADAESEPCPHLFLVSAKTRTALDRRLAALTTWLEEMGDRHSPSDIAYTLHAGRGHFAFRAAFVATTCNELAEALRGRLQCLQEDEQPAERPAAADRARLLAELRSELDSTPPQAAGRSEALHRAAELYTVGLPLPSDLLFPSGGRRIPLPTYPFERERYWHQDPEPPGHPEAASTATEAPADALPLEELSPGEKGERRFLFRPEGTEFFVTDHVIAQRPVLAGMVGLELACTAGELANRGDIRSIETVTWHRPLASDSPDGLEIRLTVEDEDTLRFGIDTPDGFRGSPAATGVLRFRAPEEGPSRATAALDLDAIARNCAAELSREECYRRFAALGFAYGPGFQTVRDLRFSDREVLARLELPPMSTVPRRAAIPALLDGALQAMIALADGADGRARVPYALDAFTLSAPVPAACHAHVVRRDDGVLDIRVTDSSGQVVAELGGVAVARMDGVGEVLPYEPVWCPATGPAAATARTILVLDHDDRAAERIRELHPSSTVILAVPGPAFRKTGRHRYELRADAAEDHQRLLADLPVADRPSCVLMLGTMRDAPGVDGPAGEAEATAVGPRLAHGFDSALALCQAMVRGRLEAPVAVRIPHPLLEGEAPSMPHLAALGGFAHTVRAEHPDLCVQAVGVPRTSDGTTDLEGAWHTLLAEPSPSASCELRIRADGTVETRRLRSVPRRDNASGDVQRATIRPGGAYLITGGTGHIGLALTRHLASLGAKVALISRSAPKPATSSALEELRAAGATVLHLQADVGDPDALERACERVRSRLGPLYGVIHAAGVTRDAFLDRKERSETTEVLAGKVGGALLLDRFTREDPLDFLVLCSSVTSVLGNPGQADYGYANAFLDAFAASREDAREQGLRHGRTLSIGWPAWAGGMAAGLSGPHAMEVTEGLAAFDDALRFQGTHLVLFKGNAEDVASAVGAAHADEEESLRRPDAGAAADALVPHRTTEELRGTAQDLLRTMLAEELRVPASRIDPEAPLENYGIDSVMVLRLSERLEAEFGAVPKTLFFQYQNLAELAGYFAKRHSETLEQRLRAQTEQADETGQAEDSGEAGESRQIRPIEHADPDPSGPATQPHSPDTMRDIAVIGVSGRYPMAEDLDAFWQNLVQGRDCVTEIPADRWPMEGFYDPEGGPGRSYAKWGGFLTDIDKFDPLFFKIAPRDADMMDPQERLFLQTVWHTLEDAGYTRAELGRGTTGVFVGVMYGEYQRLGPAADGRMGVSSHASIANRVSYFFDFNGPSIALDTMCSSSLTALHLACESLRRGECDTAVAGGVNLSVHPAKYLQLGLTRFLSTNGQCRSFGADGDGYVPGEGVGALLLKPLSAALRDGDTIHAVIRGSAVNHGGKTNGYTVPNPRAQTSAVREALRRAEARPAEIGYVEAHGTGTALGDPIEIAALTEAFGGPDGGLSIPIGSVKSMIGHLEAAAGMAAVTKVILQMRYGVLTPSLHAERLNPHIDFAESPFHVQQQPAPWPVGDADGQRRLAGVSSFGAGGANAHVILESPPAADTVPEAAVDGPQAIVLSARAPERLVALADRLADRLAAWDGAAAGRADAPWEERVAGELLQRVGSLLGVGPQDLGPHDALSECGFDEVLRVRLGSDLAQAYGLDSDELPTSGDTVAEVAAHLVRRHAPALRAHHGAAAPVGLVPGSAPPDLADIAYTLQVGREAMPHRVAVLAESLGEAVRRLRAFAETRTSDPGILTGTVDSAAQTSSAWPIDDAAVKDVAEAWAAGARVDWRALHRARRCRVPLVGYPFARERHWLDVTSDAPSSPALPASPTVVTSSEPKETEIPVNRMTGSDEDSGLPSGETHPWVLRTLVSFAAEAVGLTPERLDPRTGLGDYGFESVALKTLADRISTHFGVTLSPTVFYERQGLAGVTDWLMEEYGDRITSQAHPAPTPKQPTPGPQHAAEPVSTAHPHATAAPHGDNAEPIAVIGMSGRFPGSPDLNRYWENLVARRDLVTEVPADRWDWHELVGDGTPDDERTPYRWGAFIDDVDTFDPLFFGISPAEAEMMDPQQRVLLQTVWAAIEDAGYRPYHFGGRDVGLFAGIQFSDYQHLMHAAGVLNAQSGLGNEHSIAVNRISYLLDLHGPSEPVNTACSSSLVAVHRAVRSLRAGESEVAIAGGIALNLAPHSTVAAAQMGLLSPDGRCRTLDSGANGYVKGEGVGALLLKPLARALADGDQIHAVIRGSAVNHGGRAASLTAPNTEAQAQLLCEAAQEAGVGPESIGYLELHGTGTELGDPVEINGIKLAFRRLAKAGGSALPTEPYCGIGSVKTNIGHLEPASGIAGLIKTILAMRHKTLPGMVHLEQVNPYVDLTDSPFRIVRETVPWERLRDLEGRTLPLRAGVSSFGFGGVNAHVLLEEPPARETPVGAEDGNDRVFVFSARTEQALDGVIRQFLAWLDAWDQEASPSAPPTADDVAFTLSEGREEMTERLAVVAPSLTDLRKLLTQVLEGAQDSPRVHRGRVELRPSGSAPAVPVSEEPDRLARAWTTGVAVDWTGSGSKARGQRVSLPGYPFERKRYWFPVPEGAPSQSALVPARQGATTVAVDAREPGDELSGEEYIRAGLRDILLEKLKLADDELDENRNLQDFGVDSMLSAMIMQVVQDEFDVQVPLTALVEHPTLRSLSAYIHQEFFSDRELTGRRKSGTADGAPRTDSGEQRRFPPELVPINMNGTRQPSFWVHGAAGYSAWFQNLSQALGAEYPLYAFQARGTDGHSMPQTLEEMVDHYVDCVRLVQPEGPYVIGGYSFGGLVAMRMAQRLQEQGETIRHLVMFDTYPATQEVFDRHHGMYDHDFLQLYLTNYFLKLDQNPERAIRQEDVAHLPPSLRVAELARLAQERGGRRISTDDIYLYLRGGLVCSEHAEGIYQLFEMKPYDASDVLFFKATDGFTGRASEIYWQPTRILDGYDYENPWREVVKGEFRVVELDNDHLNQLEEPTLTPAARCIEALLKEPPALDEEDYASFRTAFEELTSFGGRLLADAFHGADAFAAGADPRGREEIRAAMGVEDRYTRLFNASLDILERDGRLRADTDGRLAATEGFVSASFAGGADEVAEHAAQLAREHPVIADYLPLLTTCQSALEDVMTGRREATDVIFPRGSMDLVAEIYKGSIQSEFYNRLVADRAAEHVRHFVRRYPYARAQIFEVGSGTGGTSTFVFDALRDHSDQLRYFFTDVGAAFLRVAEGQFGPQHPFVDFTTYDVERPPSAQGFEPRSMDVVVASNVLHTTRRIDVVLRNCRELLKPDGILIINELTQRMDYNTLTFGLTTGWWLYEDEDKRIPGSPLLDTTRWRESLEAAGFGELEIHGVPGATETEQAQCVVVAKAMAPGALDEGAAAQ